MDEAAVERKKVTLQHPTDVNLQVTVWEGTLADTLRRHGYIEIVDDPADQLPDEKGRADGQHDVDGGGSSSEDR